MKKVFMFGNKDCPDCVVMKEFLEAHGVRYSYIDIMDSLGKLKMFLKFRDNLAVFDGVRKVGTIGIPFTLVNDGEWMTLDAPNEEMLVHLKD